MIRRDEHNASMWRGPSPKTEPGVPRGVVGMTLLMGAGLVMMLYGLFNALAGI